MKSTVLSLVHVFEATVDHTVTRTSPPAGLDIDVTWSVEAIGAEVFTH